VTGFNVHGQRRAYPQGHFPCPDRLVMHATCPRQRGFSLSEVLATLAVLGVTLALAVPNLSSVTASNVRANGINELVGSLHAARNEAITRNATVVVCPSRDGATCAPVAWETGWIRFVDANGDFGLSDGELLLGSTGPLGGLHIRTDTFGAAVGYAPSGQVYSPDHGQTGGEFTFCPAGVPADARVLIVSALGHPVLVDRYADGQAPDCPAG
jgi:type IV fimbrial biogenesis protein FimT